jgi:cytochrome P450
VLHDDVFNRFYATRYDDVRQILRDKDMSSDPRKADPNCYIAKFTGAATEMNNPETATMLRMDDPDHRRLRGLMNKAFTPKAVEALRPRIREIARALLAQIPDGEFDLIDTVAGPLPVIVIAEMLGIDPADRRDFKRWSDGQALGLNPLLTEDQRATVTQSDAELEAYLRRALVERRADPRDDLISTLIGVEEAGDQLTDREIVTMCSLLLAAGNVTTTDLIGNGAWLLLRHSEQLRLLRDRPSLIANAVEEVLRFESPVVQTTRIAMASGNIGGRPIHRGESVLASLAAANRDPGRYPEPNRFDITRAAAHHHSFGGGVHFCLGAPLARLEAQVAIPALLRRFPRLRLADEPLDWRPFPGFRGLAKLWVLVD